MHPKASHDFQNQMMEKLAPFCYSPDVILCGWLGLKHQLTN